MAFADYTEYIEPLVLPIRGKSYTIPPMSLEAGLRVSPLLEGKVPEGVSDDEISSLLLGSALEEMRADGVPPAAINRAQLTALAEYKLGRDGAEIMWETGGDPKAIEKLTQERLGTANRATRRRASKASTNTGAAKKTR